MVGFKKSIQFLLTNRISLSVIIFLCWIIAINIATYNDYTLYLIKEIYPKDAAYPLNVWEYIIKNIDILYIISSEEHLFLKFIYFVMIITIFVQLLLFIFKKTNYYKDNVDFNLSIPAMLGVIGTIFAFTYYISYNNGLTDSNATELLIIFKEKFNSAAMTTIIGGVTHMFNFFILTVDEYLNKNEI